MYGRTFWTKPLRSLPWLLVHRRPGKQIFSRLREHNCAISTVPEYPKSGCIDMDIFRREAFEPEVPLVMRQSHILAPMIQWFPRLDVPSAEFSPYFAKHGSAIFPYELVDNAFEDVGGELPDFLKWLQQCDERLATYLVSAVGLRTEAETTKQTAFHQFHAPLDLMLQAIKYNKLHGPSRRIKRLYIAQSQLNDLPRALQDDLPTPKIVQQAGRGDVYDSSVWLGLEPTYTPLHRDPNPNLFVQVLSGKAVRILPPELGQRLYSRIQQQLGGRGNSRFRGQEMMEGPERAALYDAIWGPNILPHTLEAVLGPGDALFIPKGWWHSVQSSYDDGRLNASINWWFR